MKLIIIYTQVKSFSCIILTPVNDNIYFMRQCGYPNLKKILQALACILFRLWLLQTKINWRMRKTESSDRIK